MLHILLLILKMIGIILAVILGILVLLVCVAVFVPVRYEINGRCTGKLSGLKMKGKVTWLFSLIRADIYYKENKLKWRLRIAWKKFLGGQEYGMDADVQQKRTEGIEDEDIWKGHGGEGEAGEESDEEAWRDGSEESGKEAWQAGSEESSKEAWQAGSEEGREIDAGGKETPHRNTGEGAKDSEALKEAGLKYGQGKKGRKKTSEELIEDEKIYAEILEDLAEEYSEDEEGSCGYGEADEGADSESGGKVRRLLEKIKELYRRIKCTIRGICDKIKALSEKKDKILTFLKDEAHVGAFRKAKKEVFTLLRRLRPKKFILKLRFGFDDPSLTGRTVAAAAPFYPFFGEQIFLKPDFTQKVLSGALEVKGHVRFCHFAALAWKLLWNRNVRRTYKDIKNFQL